MKFINKMRKKEKGFTLVEIIVVLVILAVLAAFMIPTMLGFVGQAEKKAAIAQQREIYVAAQAIATEYFGNGEKALITSGAGAAGSLNSAAISAGTGTNKATKAMSDYVITDITPGSGDDKKSAAWTVTVDAVGRVTEVTLRTGGITLDPLQPLS